MCFLKYKHTLLVQQIQIQFPLLYLWNHSKKEDLTVTSKLCLIYKVLSRIYLTNCNKYDYLLFKLKKKKDYA